MDTAAYNYLDTDLELAFPSSYQDIDMGLHDHVDAPQINRFPQLTQPTYQSLAGLSINWEVYYNNFAGQCCAIEGFRYMIHAAVADKYLADGHKSKVYLTGTSAAGNFGQPVCQWQLLPGVSTLCGIAGAP